MSRSAQEFMQMIQENDIKMIDFKIVDINDNIVMLQFLQASFRKKL